MTDSTTDPVIRSYREQISDNDLKILEALNKRIKLVKTLKDYKSSRPELLRCCSRGLGHHLPVPGEPRTAVERRAARDLRAYSAAGEARSGEVERDQTRVTTDAGGHQPRADFGGRGPE